MSILPWIDTYQNDVTVSFQSDEYSISRSLLLFFIYANSSEVSRHLRGFYVVKQAANSCMNFSFVFHDQIIGLRQPYIYANLMAMCFSLNRQTSGSDFGEEIAAKHRIDLIYSLDRDIIQELSFIHSFIFNICTVFFNMYSFY